MERSPTETPPRICRNSYSGVTLVQWHLSDDTTLKSANYLIGLLKNVGANSFVIPLFVLHITEALKTAIFLTT